MSLIKVLTLDKPLLTRIGLSLAHLPLDPKYCKNIYYWLVIARTK